MKNLSSAILVTLSLLLAACGSGESDDISASGSADAGSSEEVSAEAAGDSDKAETPDQGRDGSLAPIGEGGPGESEPAGTAAVGTLRSVLLENALDRSSRLSSARFEGTITMVGAEGSEIPGEISLKFAGAYDLANDASEVSMDFSGLIDAMAADGEQAAEMAMFAGFFEEPLQVITIGDTSWMRWGLLSMFTGTDGMWLEGASDEAGDVASGFGFGGAGSPTGLLDLLADANVEVQRVGTETVRGASTTRYRALVDVEALAATMSPSELADFDSQLGAGSIPVLPMDFWLDDDGMLFRWVLDLSDPALLSAGESDVESAMFSFEMWDHGADLGIAPPPAAQIVTEDDVNFGFGDFAG